jgi:hypothetical protein
MQNQVLKGATMFLLIAAVALMAALVSAHAQSVTVVADVPFEFAVGSKSLTAGEYSVRAFTARGDTVQISNRDSHDSAIRLTQSIQARLVPQQTKLVFHRYGQRYFLAEIWNGGERTGRQLVKSAEERALENQLAAIPSKGEVAQSNYERVEILAMVR